MVKGYKSFLESRAYTGFDAVEAERLFVGMDRVPDCIPTNARGWMKIVNQLNRMADLVNAARGRGDSKLLSGLSVDSSIQKKILGKDDYKQSIFEIYNDIIKVVANNYGNNDMPFIRIVFDELEHLGFPVRMDVHMKLIKDAAFKEKNASEDGTTFAYETRKLASLNLLPDVKLAKERGHDVTEIKVFTRINTGGDMFFKGGLHHDKPSSLWTEMSHGRSGKSYFVGDPSYTPTIHFDGRLILALSREGVKTVICGSNARKFGATVTLSGFGFDPALPGEPLKIKSKYIVAQVPGSANIADWVRWEPYK